MELARFATSGGLITLLSIGLLQVLLALGLNPIFSLVLVYSGGASIGYVLNRSFTFRSSLPWNKTGVPFFATYLGAIGLNAGVFFLLANVSGLSPQVAISISTIVAAGWTWCLLRTVVFRNGHQSLKTDLRKLFSKSTQGAP